MRNLETTQDIRICYVAILDDNFGTHKLSTTGRVVGWHYFVYVRRCTKRVEQKVLFGNGVSSKEDVWKVSKPLIDIPHNGGSL